MLDAVGEDDAAAHAVAEHDPRQVGVFGGGDADQGVEIVGVLGDVAQVHPFAAGAPVAAEIQRVGDQPGLAEALRDVVIAAGMLGISVAEHDDAARGCLRGPHVVDDLHSADAVEASFAAGSGHPGRLAGGLENDGVGCHRY